MSHPYRSGKFFLSYGRSFVYQVQGPVCRLFDREELPWPSCSLAWKGKQPSWNRVGRRFVPDLSTMRFPSYGVLAKDDRYVWYDVVTMYDDLLTKAEKRWWFWKGPEHLEPPATVEDMEDRLENGHQW